MSIDISVDKLRARFLSVYLELQEVHGKRPNPQSAIRKLEQVYPRTYSQYAPRIDMRATDLHHLAGQRRETLRQGGYYADEARADQKRHWLISRKVLLFGKPSCINCAEHRGPIFSKEATLLRPWSRFCCFACSKKAPQVQARRVETCRKKYGVRNVSKIPEVKRRISESIDRKAISSSSRKWWSSLTTEDRQQLVEKRRGTYLARTGYEWPSQNPESRAKAVSTWRKNFGVDNPSHSPAILEKIARTGMLLSTTTIGSRSFTTQGSAEATALRVLHARHRLDPYRLESGRDYSMIDYTLDGHSYKYLPDFYYNGRQSTIVIEVKSDWTAGLCEDKGSFGTAVETFRVLQAKAAACEDQGLRFCLVLVLNKKILIRFGIPRRKELLALIQDSH